MIFQTRVSRGITLIELTIVLAIMGIIIGGVWTLSSDAINARKKTRLANQVVSIVQNVRSYFANQDRQNMDSTNITSGDSRAAKIFPTDMLKTKGITHAFGQGAFIYFNGTSSFGVALLALPSDACIDLLYNRLGNNDNSRQNLGLIAYAVNNTGSVYTFPVILADATKACTNPSDLYLAFSY